LLTHGQTDKVWQKHYLLGGGKKALPCAEPRHLIY